MQATKTNLTFKNLNNRSKTSRIIIHHSASFDVPASEIHRWHLERGFSGIGYHYLIRQDGTIEEGRPIYIIGAHAGNEGNSDSIGVCLTGNFENYPPRPAQMESLANLINYLNNCYQTELTVIGHKDIAPTLCPGKLFPWPELMARLTPCTKWQEDIVNEALKNGLITEYHHPQEPAPNWFVLAVGLNLLKKLGGIK
jgi:N-acetyl-anhydromuramyl-L-alanine amidase AmpD